MFLTNLDNEKKTITLKEMNEYINLLTVRFKKMKTLRIPEYNISPVCTKTCPQKNE